MKINKYKYIISAILLGLALANTSCVNDLNTLPLDPDEQNSESVYGKDILPYKQSLAKIYAGYAMSGNKGGDGNADISGVDGGSQASFLRGLWNLQELPTEEAHCCWSDPGIPDFNNISWTSANVFTKGLYYRFYYQIMLTNAYLTETTNDKLDARGVADDIKAEIRTYRAEARFSRALSYFYLLDMFRNVPFVTEKDPVGNLPSQIQGKELFAYIEKELLESETDMLDPKVGYNSSYGRANKAAVWSLLSRLYLNAEVYIGKKKYTESLTYSNKVLNIGYSLETNYIDMFKADNGYSKEMIFPIRYEGAATQTWGGMTFLLSSGVPSDLQTSVNSVGAWQGNRAKSSALKIFESEKDYTSDSRYSMLRLDKTTNINIDNVSQYLNNGIPVVKYYNVNKDGTLPPSNIAYTDFPLFRLSEIYLNYAEAVLRGGTDGNVSTALKYINDLRSRAYNGSPSGTITQKDLTLDFILFERGREFFHEAQRRTDLIRFDKFTGASYVWEWKGGVQTGQEVSDIYKIYPIPADEIGSNANLVQNPGY